jgi:hypothetical protein
MNLLCFDILFISMILLCFDKFLMFLKLMFRSIFHFCYVLEDLVCFNVLLPKTFVS